MTNQYKPLLDFAPFKAGERFKDDEGDVLTICDDCESYRWSVIGKLNLSDNIALISVASDLERVAPLDRDEDTPKIWRDGDAFTIDPQKYNIWYEASDGLIYVYPVKPSFLPLEAGKTYQTAREGGWYCIYVDGKDAWLKRHGDNGTAYVWDAKTGEANSLSEGWNIVALEDV